MRLEADYNSPSHRLVQSYIGVSKLHRSILERHLNKTGVYRSQHQILVYIADAPSASQREIADWLSVSTATIAVSLKKLEKGGYISRVMDQEDNRFNTIRITEKGTEIVNHSKLFFEKVEQKMFCDFTPEEFQTMEGLLHRIIRNLEEMNPKTEGEE